MKRFIVTINNSRQEITKLAIEKAFNVDLEYDELAQDIKCPNGKTYLVPDELIDEYVKYFESTAYGTDDDAFFASLMKWFEGRTYQEGLVKEMQFKSFVGPQTPEQNTEVWLRYRRFSLEKEKIEKFYKSIGLPVPGKKRRKGRSRGTGNGTARVKNRMSVEENKRLTDLLVAMAKEEEGG
jgi:hypothetical protein